MIFISFLFLVACQPNEPVLQKVDTPPISIITPNNYTTAGNSISIQIVNEESWKGGITLYLKSALATHRFEKIISKQVTSFDIDGRFLENAGIYECVLTVGRMEKDKKHFLVKAQDIVDPIEMFTGPNSIWVNDIQKTMVVALPKDKYGNAGREGDSLEFQFRLPNERLIKENKKIEDQLVFRKINSGDKSGKIFAGVNATGSSGKEQRLDAIPLWPKDLGIEIVEHLPYADSRQFYRLKTTVLRDTNGDIIPDGTHVRFTAKFKKRNLHYNAYTIDGVANVYLRNPEFPSQWTVNADIGNGLIVSNDLKIAFESNVKNVPYRFEKSEFIVGPITSYIGQYISDGTKVYFQNGSKNLSQETEDGMVIFNAPTEWVNPKIRLAGKTISIERDE